MKQTDVPVLYIALLDQNMPDRVLMQLKQLDQRNSIFIRTKVEKGMEMKLNVMSKLDPCLKK